MVEQATELTDEQSEQVSGGVRLKPVRRPDEEEARSAPDTALPTVDRTQL